MEKPDTLPAQPTPPEERFALPERYDQGFALWMKGNSYAIRSIKEYCTCIKTMIGREPYISVPKMRSYLSKKNTLLKRSSVKLFRRFLDEMHEIKIPEFSYPRVVIKKKQKESLTQDDISLLIEHMDHKFQLFSKVLYFGGLRVNEAIIAKRENIDWATWIRNKDDHGDLKIIRGKWNRDRIVPLKPSLIQEIFDYLPKRTDGTLIKGILFDFGYDRYMRRKLRRGFPEDAAEMRYVHKVYKSYMNALQDAAEKSLGKKVPSHIFRTSRATHLEQAGVPITKIQMLLGHGDLRTTSGYVVNTPASVKSEIAKADVGGFNEQ